MFAPRASREADELRTTDSDVVVKTCFACLNYSHCFNFNKCTNFMCVRAKKTEERDRFLA